MKYAKVVTFTLELNYRNLFTTCFMTIPAEADAVEAINSVRETKRIVKYKVSETMPVPIAIDYSLKLQDEFNKDRSKRVIA